MLSGSELRSYVYDRRLAFLMFQVCANQALFVKCIIDPKKLLTGFVAGRIFNSSVI
jgi:hypothetical protein